MDLQQACLSCSTNVLYCSLKGQCQKKSCSPEALGHRRRMETEGKAKVVASVWGAKFVKFLAELAVGQNTMFLENKNSP